MINEFISKVKNTGLAKTNRYRVTIALPSTMIKFVRSSELVTLFCESTVLPGLVIATTEQRIMGEPREFPYAKFFDNIPMSFYVDNDFEVKGFFDNWLNSITNTQNKVTSYYRDYIAPTVKIETLPMDSETATYTVTLYEAYPKAVSAVQLAADSREIARVNVSLNYKYYTTSHITTTGQMSSTGGVSPNQPMNIPNDARQSTMFAQTDLGFSDSLLNVRDQA